MPPMGPPGMGRNDRNKRYAEKVKPKDVKNAVKRLLAYIGEDRGWVFLAIGCVLISAGTNLAGTYML